MVSAQTKNLRLSFVKKRTFNKFVKGLNSDNVLKPYLKEILDNSVLFEFEDKVDREWALESFYNSLPSSKIKKTITGFNYLKIYK